MDIFFLFPNEVILLTLKPLYNYYEEAYKKVVDSFQKIAHFFLSFLFSNRQKYP